MNYLYQESPSSPVLEEASTLTTATDGGSDAQMLVDKFSAFLNSTSSSTPFLAVIWFHQVHLPHNAAPEYVAMYEKEWDSLHTDYYGTATDLDTQVCSVVT